METGVVGQGQNDELHNDSLFPSSVNMKTQVYVCQPPSSQQNHNGLPH